MHNLFFSLVATHTEMCCSCPSRKETAWPWGAWLTASLQLWASPESTSTFRPRSVTFFLHWPLASDQAKQCTKAGFCHSVRDSSSERSTLRPSRSPFWTFRHFTSVRSASWSGSSLSQSHFLLFSFPSVNPQETFELLNPGQRLLPRDSSQSSHLPINCFHTLVINNS